MGKSETIERSLEERLDDEAKVVQEKQNVIDGLIGEYRQKQQEWDLVDTGAEIYFTGDSLANGDVVRAWVRDWRSRMNHAQQEFHHALSSWAGLKKELSLERSTKKGDY